MYKIRKAQIADFSAIQKIEKDSFNEYQRSAPEILKRSIQSKHQEVWVYQSVEEEIVGVLILHLHKNTLRIFSIGVLNSYQNKGIGTLLLSHACNLALTYGNAKISLEASAESSKLIQWYKKAGFVPTQYLVDYYFKGKDAVRLVFNISKKEELNKTANILVVDKPSMFEFEGENLTIVSSKDYISKPEFTNIRNARVFNLCESYQYQSLGYYVSLLASAREHRVMPNVSTIQDFNNSQITRSITYELDDTIQETLSKEKSEVFNLLIYFGQTNRTNFKKLANQLFLVFESPILRVKFIKAEKWVIQLVKPMRLAKLTPEEKELLYKFSAEYFSKKRFQKNKSKVYKYDLAILVNPQEEHAPSCPKALRAFKNAGEKVGFGVEFITKEDLDRIGEFDALFIRETTNVKDHTYLMSRLAYAEGLVVMDDPWSILRCSNKIFMEEKFRQHQILTPKTQILVKGVFKAEQADAMNFPLVLKQPDSAFSLGVTKANTKEEFLVKINELFKKSDLILAQEFLYSPFDWRVGVLDGKALYACKYYMSKDHWQVYDWSSKEEENWGDSEILAIKDVPKKVLQTAIKASNLMGDSLYGVDLKEVDDQVYVIEVNDNPNLDFGNEDQILGEELYIKIMQSFLDKIEISRGILKK